MIPVFLIMIHCSKCHKPAITVIRYSGAHLCNQHFIEFVERRVKKDLKKQGKTINNSRIAVAVSGGKDSVVTLHLLHDLFEKRPLVQLYAITVDEGIKGYRDASLEVVQNNCKLLGIEHHVISFKDVMGKTMDEIAALHDDLGECSYCGVFRRLCLNRKAKELGVDKPMLYVFNKIDRLEAEEFEQAQKEIVDYQPNVLIHTKAKDGVKPLADYLVNLKF